MSTLPALCPMEIVYRDQKGTITHRLIAPLEYVGEPAQGKIVAWCFLRRELRHFLRTNVVQFKRVALTEPEQAAVALARQQLALQQAARAEQQAQLAASSATLFD